MANKECGACGEREKKARLKDEHGQVFAIICYCPHCREYYEGDVEAEAKRQML